MSTVIADTLEVNPAWKENPILFLQKTLGSYPISMALY